MSYRCGCVVAANYILMPTNDTLSAHIDDQPQEHIEPHIEKQKECAFSFLLFISLIGHKTKIQDKAIQSYCFYLFIRDL